MFSIAELRTNECPVSIIWHDSTAKELVQLFERSKVLAEAGVGPADPNELPITLADAFVVLQGEENTYKCARAEHEARE